MKTGRALGGRIVVHYCTLLRFLLSLLLLLPSTLLVIVFRVSLCSISSYLLSCLSISNMLYLHHQRTVTELSSSTLQHTGRERETKMQPRANTHRHTRTHIHIDILLCSHAVFPSATYGCSNTRQKLAGESSTPTRRDASCT